MPYEQVLLATLLILGSVLLWATNLFGLPGNWLVLATAVLFAYVTDGRSRLDLGWPVLLLMLILAATGELIEFLAGAVGAARVGGSRRGALLAMVGSMAGGVAGLFVGVTIPIPVIGSVLGALLCAALGALAGAFLGERWKGRELGSSLRVGHAAFWGRLAGTVGKIGVGAGMLILMAAALVW